MGAVMGGLDYEDNGTVTATTERPQEE